LPGDSIAVGNGVYQENTSSAGYWNITKVFTSYVTIYAENTATPDVTIQGSTSTSNVRVGGGANFYHFRRHKVRGPHHRQRPRSG
jgi:hypothetical protein